MRVRARFTVVLSVLGIAIAACPSFAQSAKSPDFRQSTWGMTQAQVMASESKPPSEVHQSGSETMVRYDSIKLAGSLAAIDGNVVYFFAHDQLVRAKYLLAAERDDLNDFIADYRMIEPLLRSAFGEPVWQKAVWLDDSLMEEKAGYLDQDRALPENIFPSDRFVGLAVSLGHLKLFTELGEGRTKVLHALTGVDGRITHQIEYRSAEVGGAPGSAP